MLNFQGQPLTPLSQTIQQGRRGFDALLGVVRDEIDTKRRADAMRDNVEAQKEIARFQTDESLRGAIQSLDFDLTRAEQLGRLQSGIAVEQAVEIYDKTQRPQQEAQALARQQEEIARRNQAFRDRVMNTHYEENAQLTQIAGTLNPIDGFIDPETGIEMVTFTQVRRNQNGERTTVIENVPYVDFVAHNQSYKRVSEFIENFRQSRTDLHREDVEFNESGQALESRRLGLESATDMVNEILNAGPMAEEYIRQVRSGEVSLNTIGNQTINTRMLERESDVNALYGSFLANYGNIIQNAGSYEIRTRGSWPSRKHSFNFDINNQSVGQLLDEFNRLFDFSREIDSPEKLLAEDRFLGTMHTTLQGLVAEYTRVNPDRARNMNDLYFNMGVESNDINQIFTRRPRVSDNQSGTTIQQRQTSAAASFVNQFIRRNELVTK